VCGKARMFQEQLLPTCVWSPTEKEASYSYMYNSTTSRPERTDNVQAAAAGEPRQATEILTTHSAAARRAA